MKSRLPAVPRGSVSTIRVAGAGRLPAGFPKIDPHPLCRVFLRAAARPKPGRSNCGRPRPAKACGRRELGALWRRRRGTRRRGSRRDGPALAHDIDGGGRDIGQFDRISPEALRISSGDRVRGQEGVHGSDPRWSVVGLDRDVRVAGATVRVIDGGSRSAADVAVTLRPAAAGSPSLWPPLLYGGAHGIGDRTGDVGVERDALIGRRRAPPAT